ncbi:hypothetical protein GBF38_001044 [Nibea albiflora]|uniref:Uncharacterized protein n=1 Tax=Nibea albiflora TaxID=240163 RepID=A0ACB7EX17_NIBAL|nr:hypothetical protein GBF38_001044 [Nibea albiflora]
MISSSVLPVMFTRCFPLPSLLQDARFQRDHRTNQRPIPRAPMACLSFQMEIEGQVYSFRRQSEVEGGGIRGPQQHPTSPGEHRTHHRKRLCRKSPESFACIPLLAQGRVCFGFGIL